MVLANPKYTHMQSCVHIILSEETLYMTVYLVKCLQKYRIYLGLA